METLLTFPGRCMHVIAEMLTMLMAFVPYQTKRNLRYTIARTLGVLVFATCITHEVFAQASISNYAFTTGTTGSLAVDANSNVVDMSTGTTDLVGPSIVTGSSEFITLSTFSFSFMGTRYTQFSVNNYGVVQLGSGAIASNAYLPTTSNTLAAFAPSSVGGNSGSMSTSSTGKIHYKVIGAFPNRCLVIEFLNMRLSQSSTTTTASNLCTWQVRLYEGNGMVEYMYGNMFVDNTTNLGNFTAGIVSTTTVHQLINLNTNTAAVNAPSVNTQSVTYTSTGNISSLHSTSNPNRRFYRFTPSAPATPTGLTFSNITGDAMIVNWNDIAINETGYEIFVSNNGGVSYVWLASTTANISTYNAVNLQAGTTYNWAIRVRKESYGTILTGTQATTGASTITATTAGGNWTSPTTWVGGVVPGVSNNVSIPNGSTVTVDATNLYCRNLSVGGGSSGTLQYSEAVSASLFVVGDVTVNAGGNFTAGSGTLTNHTLVIGGLNTNQLTNGNLTVNGTFDMNTSAAVSTTFAGNLDATISGSGTIDFFSITVNKGNSGFHYTLNPTLSCNSVITIAAATGSVNRLNLASGTFQLNSASTLSVYGGNQAICSASARLWLNNAGATIRQNGAGTTSNAGSPSMSGELRIDNGTFEYGSGNNTFSILTGATLRMTGGTLNMFGAISFLSSANTQFLLSGGTINVDANIPTANQISTGTAMFSIGTFTTVLWSGGTVNIINPHNVAGGIAWTASSGGSKVITGGTLNIGNGSSTVSGGTFGTSVGFGLTSTMPVWNVNINNLASGTNTRQARLTGNFVVANNLTVSTNGVLALGQSLATNTLQIGGNATVAGNINGNEIGSIFVSGTLFFAGNALQTLSIPGTITNVRVIQLRNPSGLTLANDLTVSQAVLETGVLNNSSATLTLGRSTSGDVPTITIGSGLNTLPAGSFSVTPTFVITAGNYKYTYNQTNHALTQGAYNEVPAGATLSVRQFAINNTSGITLTKSVTADTTIMTAGNITLGSNDYQFGTSATTPGSFTYTTATGGFMVTNGTGRVIKWMGTSGLSTTATTGSIGHFPIGSGVNNRNAFIFFSSSSALTAGGRFAVRHVEAAGSTAITSYTDGTLTGVDRRSNSSWEITTPTTPTLGAFTISLRIQGSNLLHATNSSANVTLSTATGIATGTFGLGSGSSKIDPIANRTGISSITNLTSNPYYLAAPTLNYTEGKSVIVSATSGNWSNTATWQGGVVPTANEDVIIRSGHNITLDANGAAFNFTIQSGASLTANANTLTCGPAGGGYVLFDNYGTLSIGGGQIDVNGNMIINNGSNFIMTSGNLNIDGNNGTIAGSVQNSYDLFSIGRNFPTSITYSTGNIVVTGGTITIVDPPIDGSANLAFAYRSGSPHNNWAGNTLRLGGSTGIHKSGHTNGFMVGTYISSGRLQLGNIVVNGGNLGNATLGGRFVSTPTSSTFGFDCINLTVNANSELRQPSTSSESVNVAGNLVNNGLISIQTTSTSEGLRLCMLSGFLEVASTFNQTISGTGAWRNVMPAVPSGFSSGTNYQVGDVLTLTTGTFATPLRFSITSVSATGGIIGWAVSDPGSGYTVLPSTFTLTGGSGSGATVSTLVTTNIPPTASVSSLIVNNASSTVGSGVSPISWGINNFFIGNNLTFTAGIVDIGTNTITLGTQDPITPTSRTQMGNIGFTAGGFQMTTGAVRRVFSSTLPITAGTNVGLFPITQGVNNRNLWLAFSLSGAPNAAGIISVGYNNASGLGSISSPFSENTITYNRRTNATWTVSIPNALTWTFTPTINVRLAGTGIISPISVAGLNLINNASGGTAAPGVYSAGTGSTAAPQANRINIPYANLANTYTIGAASDNLAFEAVADGNWGDPATWNTGTVPSATDNVTIPSPFTVTLAGGTPPYACNNLTINSGGTLIANANTLTIGPAGGGNRLFNMAGKLDLNGATINVNGRIDMPNAATTVFTFTSGTINVDGNDGTSLGSVTSGSTLFNVGASITNNVIGGNITIVDPPFTGSGSSLVVGTSFVWPNVNLTIGDGSSSNPSTHTSGFIINTSSTRFGNITINGGTAASRWATINNTTYTTANLTVNGGSQLRITGTCGVAGNVINNGTLITTGTLQFSLSGNTVTSGGQSATGSGVFRNNTPTATVSTGGTGYLVGDILTVGGLGGTPIQLTVLAVSAGAVTSVYVSDIGAVTSTLGSVAHPTTGGSGSGAEFTLNGAIPFALFTNLTLANNTAAGVDLSAITGSVNPANAMSTVSGSFNIGVTLLDLGTTNFVIGSRDNNGTTPLFASGSTTYTPGLGRVKTSGSYSRFYNSADSAPISTAQHIYILGTATDARYAAIYFGATNSITTSGFISVTHIDSSNLNTPTPFTDCSGLYTINRVTAGSWTFATGGGLTLGSNAVDSANIILYPYGILRPIIATDVFVTNSTSTAPGNCSPGTGTTAQPAAVRTGLNSTQFNSTYYVGADAANLSLITSVASGNWNDPNIWDGMAVPTSSDNVRIASGHTVTLNVNGNAISLNVNGGGVLNAASNTLTLSTNLIVGGTVNFSGSTVNIAGSGAGNGINILNNGVLNISSGTVNLGPAGGGNRTLSQAVGGTLNITGGTLNVNGNVLFSGGSFSMSNGNLNVDGNSGSSATSVNASTTSLFNIVTTLGGTVNGGTITIVDPHLDLGVSSTYAFSSSANTMNWAGNTINFGNGISSQSSSKINGFGVNMSSNHQLGDVNIKGGSVSRRFVAIGTGTSSNLNCVNITVDAGSEIRTFIDFASTTSLNVSGNITNNGTMRISGTLAFRRATSELATSSQVFSGTGTFESNSASAVVSSGGSGYVLGDILTLVGGTFTTPAQFVVTGASGGIITALQPYDLGAYTVEPIYPTSFTGGTGFGATATISNLISIASIGHVTFLNGNSSGINWNINNLVIRGTLNFSSTTGALNIVNLSSNTLRLGSSLAGAGTLSYILGGFTTTTGRFGRWFTTTSLPTTVTGTGQFPFVNATGLSNRHSYAYFNSATALTTAGYIDVNYADAIGLATITPFTDGTVNVNRASNATWTYSSSTLPALGTGNSISIAVRGDGIPATINTLTDIRLTQSTGALGTHINGTGSIAAPVAGRNYTTLSDIFTTHVFSGNAANYAFLTSVNTIASGNWGDSSIWSSNSVPNEFNNVTIGHQVHLTGGTSPYSCNQLSINGSGELIVGSPNTLNVTSSTSVASGGNLFINGGTYTSSTGSITGGLRIASGTITFNGASLTGLTLNNGGSFNQWGGTLTVGAGINNAQLNFASGSVDTITGGNLNVNGNLAVAGTFAQSGGFISVDGNSGTAATSVVATTRMVQFTSAVTNINCNGGTIRIVDPHHSSIAAGSTTKTLVMSSSIASTTAFSGTHTFEFGDGASATPGNADGFVIETWQLSSKVPVQNVTVNAGNATGRWVSTSNQSGYGTHIKGTLTINSGSEFRHTNTSNPEFNIGGNIVNNGTLTISQPFTLGNATNLGTLGAQTISGSGIFRNSTSSSTGSFATVTVDNSSPGGVTLSTPLSISSALTMTAGRINTTSTNLLTLGTSTAAGTLTYTAGQIVGPFARTFAASRTATGTYTAVTLFPVGDGTNYIPIHIDPTTTSGGAVVMQGQAFNTNSGTAGAGVANPLSTDRWEALINSGASNLSNCFIGLNDAQIASGNIIVQATSANGTYNTITPTSTVTVG
ncbi:MAG: hypothetical protein ACK574_06960, partial [Bacteroidota bacterium]